MSALDNPLLDPFVPEQTYRDLEYCTTDENVCFCEDMLFHMNIASRIMTGLAEHTSIPDTFKSAARLAAWLMSEEGPIQTYGHACVHKDCVRVYYEMYARLEQLFHVPATNTTAYEAVRMVLIVGIHMLQGDSMVERVLATIRALDDMVTQRSTFHFGFVSHHCIPLFAVGRIDV
jgi:hypothetical protein